MLHFGVLNSFAPFLWARNALLKRSTRNCSLNGAEFSNLPRERTKEGRSKAAKRNLSRMKRRKRRIISCEGKLIIENGPIQLRLRHACSSQLRGNSLAGITLPVFVGSTSPTESGIFARINFVDVLITQFIVTFFSRIYPNQIFLSGNGQFRINLHTLFCYLKLIVKS